MTGSPQPFSTTKRTSDARVLLVGAYFYALDVYGALARRCNVEVVTAQSGPGWQDLSAAKPWDGRRPDLIVVAGWRKLIPKVILDMAPTVGFHSAKLPEYPGRAPVPWALLRGDDETANTLIYLEEDADTGDIIDSRTIALHEDSTPESVYRDMGRTSIDLIAEHLDGLLRGTAPRTPQDFSRRGPLTTKDGWARWLASSSR